MRIKLKGKDGVTELTARLDGNRLKINLENKIIELEVEGRTPANYILAIGDHKVSGYAVRVMDSIHIQVNGTVFNFDDVTRDDDSGSDTISGGEERSVVAPMPGSVIKLLCDEGDQVANGQPLIIVEAMKMENEVKATMDGKVDKISVKPGQQVGFGEIMIELAPLENDGEEQ